jgi:hypothetical protein
MSGTGMWAANRSGGGSTEHIRLFQDGQALTFSQMFELMQNDRDFATWYTDQLRESRFPAYFWEHPPLNKSNLDSNAEFVLVNAPVLDRLRPDAEAFRSYFEGDKVVTFRNLGGDAILIAPSPAGAASSYAHLAAFLRTAADSQVHALWQNVARSVAESLTEKPMWLSTSGLGVAWLHIRLDSSPKYYQHQPYKRWPVAKDEENH